MKVSDDIREYELFKNKYIDDIEQANNYFIPILDDVCKYLPQNRKLRILDVGCGNGMFTIYLKQLVDCTLYGMDGSDYALDKAKKRGFDIVQKIVDFSYSRLPMEDDFFDFIVCKDVFEHLLIPMNLLQEIRRVLKKEGYLLAHCPNHFPFFERIKFLIHGNIDTFNYFPEAKQWDYPHIRFFTFCGFTEFLSEVGLKIKLDLSHHFLMPLPILRIRKIPKIIANKYPDLFVQGFTLLAQK